MYTQISMEEGALRLAQETGYILLDVRRQDEYALGHIPGAVCLPNEEILALDLTQSIPLLPCKSQRIFVYCRSGRRSKESAAKLAQMGYTDVVEFGGILSWTGQVEPG